MHWLELHCKKLFQDIGFCPKGKSNGGNLNILEHRNKSLSSVALFVKTHSFRKSFSLLIGQQNALSRNFIAIIIKDVHLNPLRSYWFYNTQQTSLQENAIFMLAIYARIEIVKLNDHIELSFIWWAPTNVKAGLSCRIG